MILGQGVLKLFRIFYFLSHEFSTLSSKLNFWLKLNDKMTDLNSSLQSYLSKGDQNGGSAFGKFNLGKLNFFQKRNQPLDDVPESNDVANSWFTQAKADPCLPSLVRYRKATC